MFRSELESTAMDEELTTLWRRTSMDVAISRAETDAHHYAADLGTPQADPTEHVGLAQASLLTDAPGDGAEVFSLVCGSDLEPEDYLDTSFDSGTERHRRHRRRAGTGARSFLTHTHVIT